MKRYIKSSMERPYLYIFKHGLGPGTLPHDVTIVKTKDLPRGYTAVWTDRFLTTQEMDQYDIPYETEINHYLDRIGYCQKNGDVVPCDESTTWEGYSLEACGDITASTNSAKYTIKSVSDEGTYFLVKDWRKNKELWVSKEKMDRHPEWWFTSPGKAKQSLKSLLSVMDEYLSDTFTVVDISGNETPLDVKELGFDHIPDYEDDDVDACGDIKASTNDSNIVNKIYSVMMDYEYGYDPDMTDINAMLQELTNNGVHVDTSDAFKRAWVSAHNKAERKTWGGSGDSYHYDSLTPGELEAIENYDTEYWEYVKDHPFNLKPASITSSTDTKYFANMVSASDDGYEQLAEGDDADIEEYIEHGKYYVAGYLQSSYRGLMEDMYSDDFEEILENAWEMAGQGLYVEITNRADGRSKRYTPEDFEEAASNGEYPDHIREDLAL